jgi:alpha-2-macroglobulin
MKPAFYLRPAVATAMAFLLIIISAVSCKKKGPIPFDPAFAQYISAFTSGTVSVASPVRIRLTDAFKGDVNTDAPVAEDLLSFSPSLEGELWWLDNQTLEFRPKSWLERGKVYEAELKLDRFTEVPGVLSRFKFSFMGMQQHVNVSVENIRPYRNDSLSWMYMQGLLQTLDVCDVTQLPQTVQAEEGGDRLAVHWQQGSDPHLHYFTVDSIYRGDEQQKVELKWNGTAIGASQAGQHEQVIPALGDFKVIFFNIIQQPEQYVQLLFSDPLEAYQKLEGLIDLEGAYGERFAIDANEIRIYPSYRMAGDHQLIVHSGVRNIMGYASSNEENITLHFEEMKPEVKIDDEERVILPTSNGMVFPFQAVNLSAVDVKVLRIYENNIPQFLQVNDLFGDYQMRRVGRVVKRKTVQLNPEGNTDLAIWNTFYLNLDEIIKAEPGAVYRVEIGFRKAYSLYHCEDVSADAQAELDMEELSTANNSAFEEGGDYSQDEDSEYGGYDDEYYDEYYDYDWSQRENPCNDAYYNRNPVGKNILSSDIGIIAKRGNDQSLLFAVSDIRTTKPLSGVELEVLNYQQQVISKLKTDGQGMARVERVDGVPFLVTARHGKQRGYLRLDGSHALNLSTFDISGAESQRGLKGFIYGERGVWRPGDSLFLSFILEDEKKVLPAIHPVNFELINPQGQIVQKMVRSKSENGFFSFVCSTDPDAPTGNYQANIRIGGAVFSKTLRVESIKPNRLKIALDFGPENKNLSGDVSGKLAVKWLHGAVAKNLKANVTATFTRSSTGFDKYKEYTFDDPVSNFSPEEQTIFDSQVNAEGLATLQVMPNLQGRAPGMLQASFSVKVFEEGGDFSVDRFTTPYAPYPRFVGIEIPKPEDKYSYYLETGKEHRVQVVTVDANGKAVQTSGLNWKLYKIQWRWWWERSSDDLANYVGSESTVPVASGELNTGTDGRGSFDIKVNYPEWGRYMVRIEDPAGGHATGTELYIDWPASENRSDRENPEGASILSFSLDKVKYTAGEECKVVIPSSKSGRALLSIENSTGVLEAKWIETKQGQTTYSFKTTPQMTPNAYVHISMIQPHNQTENDLPIRLYGVMPLFVEYPGSHVNPVIQMPDELAPEKDYEIKVSEKDSKAMTYTLAVVDEGLLDLTRYKTPDPWNHFYAREALGVNTFDLYDMVIGAYGAKLERILSLGGDGEGGGKGKNRANRFKPVVTYLGPFTIEAGKSKTHKLTMPNYIGSVRVMVVAGKDMAYGASEKSVPVKKPLMVLASLPRVLAPGEELQLPVTVFAMDEKIKDVQVKIEANEFFQFSEGTGKSIRFASIGDDVVNFPIRISDKVGIGKLKVVVSSGNFKSSFETEIQVRNPNPYITDVLDAAVDAGSTWSSKFDLPGMEGSNETWVEISSMPPVDFGRRMKYLLEYPHGCIEQTTSSAFPQLFISDVMELSEPEIKMANDNVKAAINRLARFQLRSGGMTYWLGYGEESDWGTSYAGHFMLEAKKKGYTLPPNWENAWVSYQQRIAKNWSPKDVNSGDYYWYENDLMQAYRLYTLALAGKPEMGAMNRLKERGATSLAAKWRLAAAYALAGQVETARAMISAQSTSVAPYVSLGGSYGSNYRDEAMIIETLTLIGERTKAAPLAIELAKVLSSDSWQSTQTVSFGLIAMAKFSGGDREKSISYTYTVNGKTSSTTKTNKPLSRVKLLEVNLKSNQIAVQNSGSGLLYVRVVSTGQPSAGNETAASSNLYMETKYFDMNGRALNVSRVAQGTDFYAEVSIWNPGTRGRYDEMALTQVFPAGWEIINQRLDMSAVVMNADAPDYQDVRDDRVLSYFDLVPNQTRKFRIKLNATYLGKFYLPAVTCSAMYDNSIFARAMGQWVEVVPAGGQGVALK